MATSQLAAFLERSGMPTAVTSLRREHVEAFMEELNQRTKPATASTAPPPPHRLNRFRALQQFLEFLENEGEVDEDVPEPLVDPLRHLPLGDHTVEHVNQLHWAASGIDVKGQEDLNGGGHENTAVMATSSARPRPPDLPQS